MPATLLIDGHVHFHPCFTWQAFLDASAANFARARDALRLARDSPGCLMLTEVAGVSYFATLRNERELTGALGWTVEWADEECSLVLRRGAADTIVVIAGRQIVTAENLEVLSFGTTRHVAERQPVGEVLRAVADCGALPIIPWGFGKWWGHRGRTLRHLVRNAAAGALCVADTGNRAGATPRPALLDEAEARGVLVLAGSDPLALPDQVTRPGSYGFVLDDWQPGPSPWRAITSSLQALTRSPRRFGELSSMADLVTTQWRIRRPAASWRKGAWL